MPSPTYAAPTYAALTAKRTILTNLHQIVRGPRHGGVHGLAINACRAAVAWSSLDTFRRAVAHTVTLARRGDSYYNHSALRDYLRSYLTSDADCANAIPAVWDVTTWMFTHNTMPTREQLQRALDHLITYDGPGDATIDESIVTPIIAAIVEGAQRLHANGFTPLLTWLRTARRVADPNFASNALASYRGVRAFYTDPNLYVGDVCSDLRAMARAREDARVQRTGNAPPTVEDFRLDDGYRVALNNLGHGHGVMSTSHLSGVLHGYGGTNWPDTTIFYLHPSWSRPDYDNPARQQLALMIAPCHICGAPPANSNGHPYLDNHNNAYCASCDLTHPSCEQCHERRPAHDLVTVTTSDDGYTTRICGSCVASGNIQHCQEHDAHHTRNSRCPECRERAANDYHVADPHFYGRSTRQPSRFFAVPMNVAPPTARPHPLVPYIGIELEVECHTANVSRGTVMQRIAHPLWRFKHDGSLRDGIEIVTFPIALEVFRSAMPEWTQMFAALDRADVMADDRANARSQAGLHVHVNRSAFTPAALLKATAMVYRHPVFMTAISGRRTDDLNQWATLNEPVENVAAKARRGMSNTRYAAVNTEPVNTVEFRLFKSTTNPVLFAGRSLFPLALLTYCEQTPARHLKMSSFIRWMQTNGQWPEVMALIELVKPDTALVGYTAKAGAPEVRAAIRNAMVALPAAEAAALYAPTAKMRRETLRALYPKRNHETAPASEDDIW